MSLLELEGVDSFYADFQALYGIDLAVDEGERVAIIGANGAGKSTLLGTVAGTLQPAAGSVRFDGRPIHRLRAHERVGLGVSLVPEGRRIFPSLSTEENLLVGGYRSLGGRWTVNRVYELFPILGPLAHRSAAALSGGEQQALAIGRALMANPRLLLLDEVSLGLAPVAVKRLYEAIPEIALGGTTILLVEQDIGQALQAADRVYCLLEGRVSLHGRPVELTRDAITAAYFGV